MPTVIAGGLFNIMPRPVAYRILLVWWLAVGLVQLCLLVAIDKGGAFILDCHHH
jgi:hypothetical protein